MGDKIEINVRNIASIEVLCIDLLRKFKGTSRYVLAPFSLGYSSPYDILGVVADNLLLDEYPQQIPYHLFC